MSFQSYILSSFPFYMHVRFYTYLFFSICVYNYIVNYVIPFVCMFIYCHLPIPFLLCISSMFAYWVTLIYIYACTSIHMNVSDCYSVCTTFFSSLNLLAFEIHSSFSIPLVYLPNECMYIFLPIDLMNVCTSCLTYRPNECMYILPYL